MVFNFITPKLFILENKDRALSLDKLLDTEAHTAK